MNTATRKLYFAFGFTLLLSSIYSNTTLSLLVSNNYGDPLENVYIESIINDSEFEGIGVTDFAGNYIFDIQDVEFNSIKLSHIGYKDKIVSLESLLENKNIVLEFSDIKSEQVVITGTRVKTYIKDTPVLTYVITSDDIENSAYSSVKEALEMSLPNIQNVVSSHAGISNEQVKIQGLDNKYLLFLVDGKRISGEFAGNLDFKMLDLSNIDRIEIIEGGMSSLYGSSAIGGVINIITKKNTKPFKLNYSYLHDDPMIKTHSLNLGLEYKKFYYDVNFVNQNTNGYDLTPNPELVFPLKTLEEYNTLSLNHILGYDNDKNFSIRANYKNYKNDIYLYQRQTLQILDQNDPNYPVYDYISYRNWIPKFKDINYGINFSFYQNSSLFTVVYNFEEYIKSNYFFNYTEEPCNQIDCSNLDNLTSSEFINAINKNSSLLIQYNKEFDENLFTVGLEYNDDSYSSYNIYHYGYTDQNGNFDGGDYNDNGECDPFVNDCLVESIFNSVDDTKYYEKIAYFIGNQWDIFGNKIGASFRYVDSKNFNDNYVYSISYMLKKYQPYDIRLNFSRGFRTPSIKELYYNWYGHSPAIIGNPDLQPTTNDYFSLSIQKFDINQDYSLELFYNNVKDMIGGIYIDVNQDGIEEYQYSNYNNILFYGINSHLTINNEKNKLKFVYNFTNPESDSKSALQLISKHSFRFNWLRDIIRNKLDISFNLKYTSEKFVVLGADKVTLEDYFISDLIIIYDINKNFELKAGYKNLFDYKDNRRFLESGNDFLSTYDPGRRIIIELKFNFDK